MELQTGKYGAKVQSWKRANPRDLLKAIIEQNPKVSERKLLAVFASRAKDDEDLIDTIIEYWFVNNSRSIMNPAERQQRLAIARTERAVATAAAVKSAKSRIEALAAAMTLAFVMPNGKQLRECTGIEVGAWGRVGAKIAKIVGKRKVGDVLSDAQLKKLQK